MTLTWSLNAASILKQTMNSDDLRLVSYEHLKILNFHGMVVKSLYWFLLGNIELKFSFLNLRFQDGLPILGIPLA